MFGYKTDGEGRVIFIFTGEINPDVVERFTWEIYTSDFSECEHSSYESKIAGKLKDEVRYDYLIKRIKEGKTSEDKLLLLFKEILDNKDKLMVVDDENKKIYELTKVNELKKYIKKFGKNLILLIKEYDHRYVKLQKQVQKFRKILNDNLEKVRIENENDWLDIYERFSWVAENALMPGDYLEYGEITDYLEEIIKDLKSEVENRREINREVEHQDDNDEDDDESEKM